MIKLRHVPLSVLLVGLLTACGARAAAEPGGPETLELRYQGSVGAVTFPEFAEELGYLGPIKLTWIGNTISGPQDIQAAATGQTDFNGAIAKRKRNEDTAAIQFWKSSGVANKGGVIDAREFWTWGDWLEREGEIKKGQVRAEDLFTNAYNPFGGTR
ncbi:hypothetical protein ABZV14_36350 [Streptosporangium canum]|uniref:hypothetical protein n=1 Tax=Streptosporangium canum TaxID=324952 RepID=UPI0033BE4886